MLAFRERLQTSSKADVRAIEASFVSNEDSPPSRQFVTRRFKAKLRYQAAEKRSLTFRLTAFQRLLAGRAVRR
jgi:hypothetical protein